MRRWLLLTLWCAAAVGLPAGLDAAATHLARGGLERALSRRAGGRVTIGRVDLVGALRLRLSDVRLTLSPEGLRGADAPPARPRRTEPPPARPGRADPRSLTAKRVEVGLAPGSLLRGALRIARVAVAGGRVRWMHPAPVASLQRIWARLRRGGARPEAGGAHPGAAAALAISLERVLLAWPARRRGGGWDRVVLRNVTVERDGAGHMLGSLGVGRLWLSSGEGIGISGLRWQARPRRGGGMRLSRAVIARARLRCRRGRPCGPWLSARADELAPDLIQVDVARAPQVDVAAAPAGRGPRWHLDVDLRRRAVAVRGALPDLPLDQSRRWLASLLGPLSLPARVSRARADLSVDAIRVSSERMEARGRLVLRHLVLRHRGLAARPVRLDRLRIEAAVRYVPQARRVILQRATVRRGGVALRLSGSLQPVGGHLRGEASVALPPTPCQRVLDAVPADLAPALAGMRLAGRLSGSLSVQAGSARLDDLQVRLRLPARLCTVVADPPRADVHRLQGPFAFTARPPRWRPTRLEMGPARPDWVPYRRLGRNVIAAFLAAEDRRFFEHHGFDLENIRRALVADLRQEGFVKGASSISQQVVKNVFLSHRRTLARKLQEAVLTWRLEQVLSKRRILEIYLNLVEMGPGLFGVRAGAWHYFRKAPHQLNPLEAAHLAAVTPNPRGYFARFRSGRAGMDWLLHLRWLLYQMYALGWIDRATYQKYRVADLRLITDPSWRREHPARRAVRVARARPRARGSARQPATPPAPTRRVQSAVRGAGIQSAERGTGGRSVAGARVAGRDAR